MTSISGTATHVVTSSRRLSSAMRSAYNGKIDVPSAVQPPFDGRSGRHLRRLPTHPRLRKVLLAWITKCALARRVCSVGAKPTQEIHPTFVAFGW